MGKIIYYSNYCDNSKKLISVIGKSEIKNGIHFICIDKRNVKNGKTYVVLETNQEVLLPSHITSVPALLLLNENYKTFFGNDILEYLKPVEKKLNNIATNNQGEPDAFAFLSHQGVVSDNFSFLDQTSDELSAKGDGGLRQTYNHAILGHDEKIETPPEDYVPDKIGEADMKNMEQSRQNNL